MGVRALEPEPALALALAREREPEPEREPERVLGSARPRVAPAA